MSCLKKTVLLLCIIALLLVVSVSANAESGRITNFTPYNIIGMWVNVRNGQSGWATLTQTSIGEYDWYFNAQGKDWWAHIGVGFNPQNWEYHAYTDWTNGSRDITITWNGSPTSPMVVFVE